MENFKVGQIIKYKNGSLSIYTGKIVKITTSTLIVVDNEGMDLYNSGYSVGSEICFSQVI